MSRRFQPGVDSRYRKEVERRLGRGEQVEDDELSARFDGDLYFFEQSWVIIQPVLLADGYLLRQRYHPDWKPKFFPMPDWAPESWGPRVVRQPRENSTAMLTPWVMDAVRSADGLRVVIKEVKLRKRRCPEAAIMNIFAGERAGDARNHCVRLLDTKMYREMPGTVLLIMPYLLPCDITPFENMAEILEFLRQVLEGVAYMHEHDVSHRDIATINIRMYSPDLFPGGTHHLYPGLTPGWWSREAYYRARHDVFVRYYLIDFGLSTSFPDFASRRPMRPGTGRYKHAPELLASPSALCDGFALDVWCIGNLIAEEFLDVYGCPTYLREFARTLMQDDPLSRPSAQDALARINYFRQTLRPEDLDRPLGQEPSLSKRFVQTTIALARELTAPRRRVPLNAPPPVFPRTFEM